MRRAGNGEVTLDAHPSCTFHIQSITVSCEFYFPIMWILPPKWFRMPSTPFHFNCSHSRSSLHHVLPESNSPTSKLITSNPFLILQHESSLWNANPFLIVPCPCLPFMNTPLPQAWRLECRKSSCLLSSFEFQEHTTPPPAMRPLHMLFRHLFPHHLLSPHTQTVMCFHFKSLRKSRFPGETSPPWLLRCQHLLSSVRTPKTSPLWTFSSLECAAAIFPVCTGIMASSSPPCCVTRIYPL